MEILRKKRGFMENKHVLTDEMNIYENLYYGGK